MHLIVLLSSISTATQDYSPVVDQPLTFTPGPGGDRACFNVSVLDDTALEEIENFNLALNSTDPDVVLDPDMAQVTIADTDSKILHV